MTPLAKQECVPCKGGEPTATDEEIKEYRSQVPNWDIHTRDEVKQLERIYRFDDFKDALKFTNQVGEIAEQQNHHPKLVTEWGKVKVTWWTHKIGGLHKNDFVMAAKTDDLYNPS